MCCQVKAVVLDPRNGFNVDRTLTKQDIQKLEEVSNCIGFIIILFFLERYIFLILNICNYNEFDPE